MNAPLSVELLRQLLAYDPETGVLTWRKRPPSLFDASKYSQDRAAAAWNSRFAGKPAMNAPDSKGYLNGGIFARTYLTHRVVWAIHYGEWPNVEIDHINHDGTDNRIANLRLVSSAGNKLNLPRRRSNKTGVTGVFFNKQTRKFHAYIKRDGQRRHLGCFGTKDAATAARKSAERELGFHPNHGAAR